MVSRGSGTFHPLVGAALLLLGLFPPASESIAGQDEAGVLGQVTDESGAVLPGVTVTATSPALQVPTVTDVTNARGEYRLTPLPIGTYTIEYSLSGFQAVRREGVRLTGGFVAKIDVLLKVGSLSETVTVSGASPVVDVTTTASTTQLTRETLELIPTSRNGLIAVMAQAPGVVPNLDVGGSSLVATPSFHAFGRSGDAWQSLEGVVTISPKSQANGGGNYFDYASFEEAEVQTVANDAETPASGIRLNTIIKSGGNDFHGSGFFADTNHNFQSTNLDAALAAQGITSGNPIETRRDASGDLGGRLVRDKLWFYGGARRRQEVDDVLQCFQPDGSPCTLFPIQMFATIKLSYQMSASNRLVGFDQWQHKDVTTNASRLVPWDSRYDEIVGGHTSKIEWQAVKGNSIVTSLQFGHWHSGGGYRGFLPAQPTTTDLVTGVTAGDSIQDGAHVQEHRYHARGSVSWFKPDLLAGNHSFKAGFDFTAAGSDRPWDSRGNLNYELITSRGAPTELAVWNYPVNPIDDTHYTGVYGEDSWTIARRLTLNMGFRYSHDNGYTPAQCRAAADPPGDVANPAQCFPLIQFPVWNVVAPRLHAAYDISGDGKTVIKGGWGRFDHMRQIDEVQDADKNVANQTLYRWHDLNGNGAYDPGEVNLNPNGPDFISTALQGVTGALYNGQPNPNEKEPMLDEFSLQFERELMRNFAVRVTGVYTRTLNSYRLENVLRPPGVYTIGITNPIPLPGGTGTTGQTLTYYDYPAAYAGLAFQQPELVNDPAANQTYKSFEIAASKRLYNRWQFMASYSATKKRIPLIASTGGGNTLLINTDDPNSAINNSDNTWEWEGRSSASYAFPWDVLVSANYENRSGTPYARTAVFTGGQTIPTITLNVEPFGSERLPNINLLDIRVEKTIPLTKRERLTLRLNVYNLLNTNAVTALTALSGPNYGHATAIVPPRIFELSAAYRF
jgi:hypothetical protein